MSDYSLHISPAAREDLIAIHRYGAQAWGSVRSDDYLQNLKEQFSLLTQSPQLGTERNDVLPGMRSLPVSSHVVFYRLRDDCIEVVRVLHSRQDHQRHLR
jgi:toxin ParE1/3/4